MSKSIGSKNIRIGAPITSMSTGECVTMARGFEEIGSKSAVYAASPALQAVVPPLIQAEKDLAVVDHEVELQWSRYVAAVGARDAARNVFNKTAGAAIAVAKSVCTTPEELHQLTLEERPPAVAAPATPTKIVAAPGDDRGTARVHCATIAGLRTYEAELSADAGGPSAWQLLPGMRARRTLTGLASGQRYWIRFRTRRGDVVSEWSDPVAFVAR